MRLVQDSSWSRRGLSLLWGPELLAEVAKPEDVLSIRGFFDLARNWPQDLPSGGGRTLVVAGVEGCVDLLPPAQARIWLEEELRPRVLAFQDEYESQAALVLWLPDGRRRVRMVPATESYVWVCAGEWRNETIPLGQCLWSGAESDVGRILDTREKNQDFDGPAWIGLHHPRIS
jgi:hypothetical protein